MQTTKSTLTKGVPTIGTPFYSGLYVQDFAVSELRASITSVRYGMASAVDTAARGRSDGVLHT